MAKCCYAVSQRPRKMVGRKNEKIIYSADQLVFGLFLGANTKTMTTTAVLLSDDGLHFATTSITQPDPVGWGRRRHVGRMGSGQGEEVTSVAIPTLVTNIGLLAS